MSKQSGAELIIRGILILIIGAIGAYCIFCAGFVLVMFSAYGASSLEQLGLVALVIVLCLFFGYILKQLFVSGRADDVPSESSDTRNDES